MDLSRNVYLLKQNGCIGKEILKNNMKGKDFERDRCVTKQKIFYEGIFSLAM